MIYKEPQECPECGGEMKPGKETAPWDEEVPLYTCEDCGEAFYLLGKDDE
ncbi:MAG: hypothetical protein SVT56_01810 [Chloroflexota bacterium]|nr:hypothetical protein [Chloroflexota bacterium]